MKPVAASYAVWLAKARQALGTQQNIVSVIFSADNTAVSFDQISYATSKFLPEKRAEQE